MLWKSELMFFAWCGLCSAVGLLVGRVIHQVLQRVLEVL